jgi:leucyl-tRNA synthetase
LEKVWKLGERIAQMPSATDSTDTTSAQSAAPARVGASAKSATERLLHKTIKKVGDDIEAFKFNTAISALMVLVNEMAKASQLRTTYYVLLLKLLSPFAPHITEELWSQLPRTMNHELRTFLVQQPWPSYDPNLVIDDTVDYVIQVNARMRDQVTTPADITQEQLLKLALASAKVQAHLKGISPTHVVFVKGRLMNLVV